MSYCLDQLYQGATSFKDADVEYDLNINTFHTHKQQTAGQGLNFEKHLQEKYIVGNISSYLSW